MQDIKNRTGEVTEQLAKGPVLLMNRATPQVVIVSTEQWNAIVDRKDEHALPLLYKQRQSVFGFYG